MSKKCSESHKSAILRAWNKLSIEHRIEFPDFIIAFEAGIEYANNLNMFCEKCENVIENESFGRLCEKCYFRP